MNIASEPCRGGIWGFKYDVAATQLIVSLFPPYKYIAPMGLRMCACLPTGRMYDV
jgi:hypothetical protein